MKLIYIRMPRSIRRCVLRRPAEGSARIVAAPQGSAFGLHLAFAALSGRTSFPPLHVFVQSVRHRVLHLGLQHQHREEVTLEEIAFCLPISPSCDALEIQLAIQWHVRCPVQLGRCQKTSHREDQSRSCGLHLEDRTRRTDLPVTPEASDRLGAVRPFCPTHHNTTFPRRS